MNKIIISEQALMDFLISTSFLVDNIECTLEDYEHEGELEEKVLEQTKLRIAVVKKFKEILDKEVGFNNV